MVKTKQITDEENLYTGIRNALLQHDAGRQHRATNVKNILATTKKKEGFGLVLLCQGVGFEAHFIAEFKDRLMSCYKQNWHSQIESDHKYR